MGVGGGGKAKRSLLPQPHPSPCFGLSTAPLIQICFFPQSSASIKIKDGGHTLVKKLLSTRSPKLRLFYKLAYMRHHPNLQENYDIFHSDLWQRYPMSKGCCGIFSSHHIQLGFFPFLSLREKYFKILLCLSLIPSLKRSRANTAKSRQPQVSWGHAMSYLMRGNPKNKSYLHNYALIVSGDFYQISVFSLSTKT